MAARRITFVLEDFIVGAPSQQLLDRFLIGYMRDGEFRRRAAGEIEVWLAPQVENSTTSAAAKAGLAERTRDFKLVQHTRHDTALNGADAVIVISPAERVCPRTDIMKAVLQNAPAGAPCFIHGCLATNLSDAHRFLSLTSQRNVSVTAATSVATTFRLPDVQVPMAGALAEALIVVQGPQPIAELAGIDGIATMLSRRNDETGIRSVLRLEGRRFWRAGEEGLWSKSLLAAAISRSNTNQGDSVRDGRTQDLIGLGLVKKLARDPRGWIIEQRDGTRSAILVLNGVIADINFAVRSRDGAITSAQLYRPPPPARAEFDRLAGTIDDFLTTRVAPFSVERVLLVSQFMEAVCG